MKKNIQVNIEQEVQEELQKAEGQQGGSTHQMVQNGSGQYVDAHVNMSEAGLRDLGQRQVESLLVLQTDSDTLRLIDNAEIENRILK